MFNFACLFNWLARNLKNKSAYFLILNILPVISSASELLSPHLYTNRNFGPFSSVEVACKAEVGSPNYNGYSYKSPGYDCYCYSNPGNMCASVNPRCPAGYLYDKLYERCYKNISIGKSMGDTAIGQVESRLTCAGGAIANPIGNKYQHEIDYQEKFAAGSITFSRSYNSFLGSWTHSYSSRISLDGEATHLIHADGRRSTFKKNSNILAPDSPETGSLVRIYDGWIYSSPKGEILTFDSSGRLMRKQHLSGLIQVLTYNGASMTITNSFGHTLVVTQDSQYQPLTLTADGLSIRYDYNASRSLGSITRTHLGKIERRTYYHEDTRNPKLLTGINDERGVRYATWTYDAHGRAISSQHAGGAGKVLISYNTDGSSTVTNELGKKSTYQFQIIQGVKRITAINGEPSAGCPMSNSTFTYDTRGLLKTKTDNKDFSTTYEYNDRGLEIIRTEATGTAQARTTTTTWHTTLYLPLTVTEPGRVTTYTYDTQGRQLSQTSASTALLAKDGN